MVVAEIVGMDMFAAGDLGGRLADRLAIFEYRFATADRADRDLVSGRDRGIGADVCSVDFDFPASLERSDGDRDVITGVEVNDRGGRGGTVAWR